MQEGFSSLSWVRCVVMVGVILQCSEANIRRSAPQQTLGRQRPRSDGRSLTKQDNTNLQYWFCPDVVCMEIPSTCRNVEYIVYEPEYVIQGSRVKVRCESCPYCLDMPAHFNQQSSASRRRRSISLVDSIRQVAQRSECDSLQCPSVTENCEAIRWTAVSLKNEGRYCGHCPACYDSTVHSTSSIQLS